MEYYFQFFLIIPIIASVAALLIPVLDRILFAPLLLFFIVSVTLIVPGHRLFDDHSNYIVHYNFVRYEANSFREAIFITKDIVSYLFIKVGVFFGFGAEYFVPLYAIVTGALMYLAMSKWARYRTVLLSVYIIFFSYHLNFNAIRAALAISCLFMVTQSPGVRSYFWLGIAGLSHIASIILILPAAFLKRFFIGRERLFFLALACFSAAASNLLLSTSRGISYSDNQATIFGIIPIIFLFLSLFILMSRRFFRRVAGVSDVLHTQLFYVGSFAALSVGLTFGSVSIGYRFLEIGCVIAWYTVGTALNTGGARAIRKPLLQFFVCVSVVIIFRDIASGSWVHMSRLWGFNR